MELKVTLPILFTFENDDERSLNILSKPIRERFKDVLKREFPEMTFDEGHALNTNRSWILVNSYQQHYNILLDVKERRDEKKLIIRPLNIQNNDIYDLADLSRLYLILINMLIEPHSNSK